MQIDNRCRRKFIFRFGDCDCQKRASVYSIMKLLTELSGEDYEERGLGHSFLWEHGQTFLISRMRLQIARLPVYTEAIVADTWERTVKGPYFYRDYDLYTPEGERLIIGTSMWMLIDPATREILHPAALIGGMPKGSDECVPCTGCKKQRPNIELPLLGSRRIYYSDLDANGHVNNAVYCKIASDYLPETVHKAALKALDLTFSMETRLGQTLELRGGETSGGFVIQGFVENMMHFSCEYEL